ncbi:MAG: ECF transporter S component [Ruminococcaceae bacterium]|nr:ECF transporter S component [Oscillospiraceae bacterium]
MKTKKMVISAMFLALVCISTIIVKVPSPLKGYFNLGDCMVLLSGWMLSPFYGFVSAGIGSLIADVISGYVVYAPATFIIKGAMAIIAHYIFKIASSKIDGGVSRIISGFVAEIAMVLGYYIFEGFLYGFLPSIANIPANAMQGLLGLIVGVILVKILKNISYFKL